uniref:SUN domain-containing protein n=1 Tax=Salarias fasciatus TaxID=181472 RepID=A0A672FWP6_SALFA
MSRRSTRLVSGGYYNSDEESDSSTVTSISYRENPVKVFKKKAGRSKAASRTSSRANSNASSAAPETPISPDQYEALTPSPSSSQVTMRTVSYVTSAPTPRPALTPLGSRSQTPARGPSTPPERSYHTRHCSSGAPGRTEPGQSGVDSSGYSSSEGAGRKPCPVTGKLGGASRGPCVGLRSRISSAFSRLIESASSTASSTAAAAHSKVLHLTALAGAPSSRRHMKKAAVVLLFLFLLLCVWLLLPFFTSYISLLTSTKTVSQTKPVIPPAAPAARPLTPPQPSIVRPSPVVDPAVVSAAVDAKMERLLVELQLKQERLVSQMKEALQQDLQEMKAQLEAADSSSWAQLQQEVTGLSRQLAGFQTDSQAAAASLSLRVQTLEAQGAQLSQDLSSVRLTPPPAPCPAPSAAPALNHLTPELQQALEKWFTDRVKEQDAIRLADKGGCTDCGRPMADRMPDFALESQGASVVSTRCSETYGIRSACVTLFGFPLWYPSESPRTVIQGFPVLLPGKCWAFHGVQGTLLISLSHPVMISHVTLDHLPRYNSPTGRIDSAPKDFQVYVSPARHSAGALIQQP